MKAIVLCGGKGTRLSPLTNGINKQILPVYNKPMVYYGINTLMQAGINDILIICQDHMIETFRAMLGDGSLWGITLQYAPEGEPLGCGNVFNIAKDYMPQEPVSLIFGDNIFAEPNLEFLFAKHIDTQNFSGATVFCYAVPDPQRFGVATLDASQKVIKLEEKPQNPTSNYCVPGLYFYDETVWEKVTKLVPSNRGELEITDINKMYLAEDSLRGVVLPESTQWFDTGTFDSLFEAGEYIQQQEQKGVYIGYPERTAISHGWIGTDILEKRIQVTEKSGYADAFRSAV